MPNCCAFGCNNAKQKDNCRDKTFFTFPFKNPLLVKKWIIRIRRDGFKPTPSSVICSDHFEEECFVYQPFTNRRQLKPGSIPSKFVFSKEKKPRKEVLRERFRSTSTLGDAAVKIEDSLHRGGKKPRKEVFRERFRSKSTQGDTAVNMEDSLPQVTKTMVDAAVQTESFLDIINKIAEQKEVIESLRRKLLSRKVNPENVPDNVRMKATTIFSMKRSS